MNKIRIINIVEMIITAISFPFLFIPIFESKGVLPGWDENHNFSPTTVVHYHSVVDNLRSGFSKQIPLICYILFGIYMVSTIFSTIFSKKKILFIITNILMLVYFGFWLSGLILASQVVWLY